MPTFAPSVSECEDRLRRLLHSWGSRYRFIILRAGGDAEPPRRVVHFRTEWARRPSPHEPLPGLRVAVHFSFLFDAKGWARAGNTGPPPAQISYRIEHESQVHRVMEDGEDGGAARNIDHHILRHLKFKGEFARRNALPLTPDQTEFFASRAAYEPLARVQDTHLASFAEFAASEAEQAAADASDTGADRSVERALIDMFQRADYDKNGSLDPQEFEDLLLNSKFGFTKDDVSLVMQQHDANSDGKLVYSEFIPIAIDLVQAQRASAYAQTMTARVQETAYQSALTRIKNSRDLHRAMDAGLAQLDPHDTGAVSPQALAGLLRGMDMELTEQEIVAIISRVRAANKAAAAAAKDGDGSVPASGAATPSAVGAPIPYKPLQDNYEQLLLDCLQRVQLEQDASDVEVYLHALFRQRDPTHSGVLDAATLTEVLREQSSAPNGIALSSTQIHAIVGDHRPSAGGAGTAEGTGGVRYRAFARKAAHMIYQLFEASSLAERSSMIKRSAITPVQLLGTNARRRIEQQMRSRFREFDADSDGRLSPAEFAAFMRDTGLLLSDAEIATLRARADADEDGFVDLNEFMQFAYGALLHLQRDAALKARLKDAIKHSKQQQQKQAEGKEQEVANKTAGS